MTKGRHRLSRRVVVLWIVLAALCATSPLVLRGTSCGHDLSFHLLNWMEVASQWRHGIVRPFWCFHAAWNAGEPRFVFYPPLSWTVGAALGFLLPWTAVPVAYTLLALLLCGLTMHRLLRDFIPPQGALLGACLYLANPYTLFTAMERSAYGELLAAAWMPLLLRAVLQSRMEVVQLAVPVALLWLTNAPAAVAASYALLLLGLGRCAHALYRHRWRDTVRLAARMVGGYALGLALSAFFLLPAIVQRHLVQIEMAVLPGMRPADNFLFSKTGEPLHDAVLHQASLIGVGLLAFGLACSALALRKHTRHTTWRSMHDRKVSLAAGVTLSDRFIVFTLAALLLLILLLLAPASAAVWRHAPELAFLQFPWRFLAVGAAATAMLAALSLPRRLPTGLSLAAGLAIALSAGWAAHAVYSQPCDDEDSAAAQQALFEKQAGPEPTDEYTPAAADNDALQNDLPQAWVARREDDGPGSDRTGSDTPLRNSSGNQPAEMLQFEVPAQRQAGFLIVRLRQFKGWHVVVDGRPTHVPSQRNDGLLAVPLLPGPHHVTVRYAWTWDEIAGLLLSACAAGSTLWIRAGWRRQARQPENDGPLTQTAIP